MLHFRVVARAATARELEATSTDRPGSGRRVLYLRDVTTRRRRERELERMAYTDHLTALPNRAQLFEEMAAPARQRCLLVLDLDGFKAVNDVAGHEAGDQLLVEVARRLHTVVREDDLVARLGGDEFAVLVTGSIVEAEEVAQRVVDVLGMPHRTGEWAFAVGASVGVAELGAAGGQFAFREADAALRAAKQAGKGCVRLADHDGLPSSSPAWTSPPSSTRARCSRPLDAACDADGRIDVVHAVPVWEHAVHGTVRAQDLWGAAERQGRSGRSAALAAAPGLPRGRRPGRRPDHRRGQPARRPRDPEGLADQVADALAESGLAPSRLTLSFTEETLLTSSAALVPELEAARAPASGSAWTTTAWATASSRCSPGSRSTSSASTSRARPARRHRPGGASTRPPPSFCAPHGGGVGGGPPPPSCRRGPVGGGPSHRIICGRRGRPGRPPPPPLVDAVLGGWGLSGGRRWGSPARPVTNG